MNMKPHQRTLDEWKTYIKRTRMLKKSQAQLNRLSQKDIHMIERSR